MARSCSEWLGESSLANEAAQRVSSSLLRNVCVCVSMREQAGVWHHIHLVCFCNTTQLPAAAASEADQKQSMKNKQNLSVRVKQKGKSVLGELDLVLHLLEPGV